MCFVSAASAGSKIAATMANVSIGATAVGAVATTIGAVKQSKAAKDAAESQNAQVEYEKDVAQQNEKLAGENRDVELGLANEAESNAQDAERRGRDEASRYRQKVQTLIGRQKAVFAVSGVDVEYGTPIDTFKDTYDIGESDVAIIRDNAGREAAGFRDESYAHRVTAHNYEAAGGNFNAQAGAFASSRVPVRDNSLLTAGTSLLGSVGAISDRWYTYSH